MNTRKRKAFTLVEVIIALIVSSISLLGLIRLHLISISMAEAAEITSQAILLAEEKIAETLVLGYPAEGIKSGQVEKKSQVLHWQTEVTDLKSLELTNAEIARLRKVYVEISFKQRAGSKSLHMSTYVADRRFP